MKKIYAFDDFVIIPNQAGETREIYGLRQQCGNFTF